MKDDISNCSFQHGQLTYDTNGCPRIHFADGTSTSCLKGTEGQFTGLTDKNGKEIYEGHLLRYDGQNHWVMQVEFKNAYVGGWVLTHPSTEKWVSLGARNPKDIEVIGNIHENSELLNN
jgi:uncharacterized phage protein (TIGR01671 family)